MHKKEKLYGRKALILACALTMAASATVGGTVAWLMMKTDEVKNTFTYGDIDITLEETPNTDEGDQNPDDGDPNTNTYEMVPGTEIFKDPTVTVLGDSEACWLFVEVTPSANFGDYMTYEMADGWKPLTGVENVFYRETAYSDADQAFAVIKDNAVSVAEDLTKTDLNGLDESGAYPTLNVTAYAVQRASIDTVAEAWTLAQAE